jgi:hypothetical protein
MSDMYAQYHSACPGLDTKTKGHRHSSRCRKITIISVARSYNEELLTKAIVAFVLGELNRNQLNLAAGRHTVRVDDEVTGHIDVTPQAPSSDQDPVEWQPDADSDPSGTDEQLQLEL